MSGHASSSGKTPTGETVFRRRQDVVEAPSGDALLFMSMEQGEYFMVDSTARAIWDLIDGERTVDGIVDALVAEYDVDRAACAADVSRFAAELEERGLVERAG